MVEEGHTSKVIRKHETLIMDYVKELGNRDALDELPPLVEEESVEDLEQEAGNFVQKEHSLHRKICISLSHRLHRR